MPKACDRVYVSIAHHKMGVHSFTLPAYTVPPLTLGERITEATSEYINRSREAGKSVSMADFALYMIGLAAQDPVMQDAP